MQAARRLGAGKLTLAVSLRLKSPSAASTGATAPAPLYHGGNQLGSFAAPREAIFTLPNGLFGFLIADANGTLQTSSDVVIDPFSSDFRTHVPVSCARCHSAGLLPVADEVRTFAQANGITYDQETLERVGELYVSADALERTIADDNTFFETALGALGVSPAEPEPVASIEVAFDLDVPIEVAAGELGISVEELRESLPELPMELNVFELSGGPLDRDDWGILYAEALCALTTSGSERPRADFCAQR